MRASRLLLLAIALAVLALVGAWRGSDHAAASSAGAPSIAFRSAMPCVSQGLQAGPAQQTVHHAGLVIVFPEGRIETRCVEFNEDSISGTQLLQESGLTIVFSSFGGGLGAGVCRIDDVGCSDPGNCFCRCQGASCAFWSYFKLDGSTWRYENVGPATRRLHDGDTDAWVWGSGHAGPGEARAPCPPTPSAAVPTPTAHDGASGQSQTGTPAATARGPTVASAAVKLTVAATAPARTPTRTPPPTLRKTLGSTARDDDGLPPALIAFGAVASALMLGLAGFLWWRRSGG